MTVKRIVANVYAENVSQAQAFYGDLLGLDVLMNHGWIQTFGNDIKMQTQISIASEGGSGSDVPQISVEVDNVDELYENAKAKGLEVIYELTDEPWGVRRFYVKDPFGQTVNVLQHM